jgi:hypothetical protein
LQECISILMENRVLSRAFAIMASRVCFGRIAVAFFLKSL